MQVLLLHVSTPPRRDKTNATKQVEAKCPGSKKFLEGKLCTE